jgi:hypothetical protein
MLAVAFLAASGMAVDPLRQMRHRYDLTNEPVKGLSPKLALATQVLGWVRGIIIDVIWIRMEALKRQGRYFELVQLADWACKLTPRIPEVWDDQAWNMSYNVSCQLGWFPDRWAWVKSGMELLRDEGIPLNPNAPNLYKSLAYIIFHKIGQQDDFAHVFYKERFGLLMHECLGGPGDRQTLEALASAPATREELLQDGEVRRLVTTCQELGFDVVGDYFTWFGKAEGVPEKASRYLAEPYNREPLEKVATYARARRLRAEYRMDPERMLNLVDAYGPFDWRSPYPHAIYWAAMGLEKLAALEERTYSTVNEFGLPVPYAREYWDRRYKEKEKLYDFERVNLERLIYASLQNLVAHGRWLYDARGRRLKTWGSDYRFADATLRMLERAKETWGIRYQESIQTAYVNFLGRGMIEFYFTGDVEKSEEYYKMLAEEFPGLVGEKGYDEFLEWKLKDFTSAMSFSDARRFVQGFIYRSIFYAGFGADDKAAEYENKARWWADNFDPEEKDNLRGSIRFEKLLESAMVDVLTGQVEMPPEVTENLKARMGEEKVARILERVKEPERGTPVTEDVPDYLKREPE